jgi:hypothetical protein
LAVNGFREISQDRVAASRSVAKQARNAYDLIDALDAAGIGPADGPMLAAKELAGGTAYTTTTYAYDSDDQLC